MAIDPTQYRMLPEEISGGQAGIDAYNRRITSLRAADIGAVRDPNAAFQLGQRGATNVSDSVPQIGDIMTLLTQYQRGFRDVESSAQREQALREAAPPAPGLEGAPPSLQEGVRSAQARALGPTIGGAKDVIQQAGDLFNKFVALQEKNKQDAIREFNILYANNGGAWIAQLNPEQKRQWESNLGFSKGSLDTLAHLETIKEKQAQTQQFKRIGTDQDGNPIYGYVSQPPSLSQPPSIGVAPTGTTPQDNRSGYMTSPHPAFDPVTSIRPDPKTGNIIDPSTGRSPSSIYQSALEYAFKDGNLQQFVGGLTGRGKSQRIKDQIANTAAAIAADLGVDLPVLQAVYKANVLSIDRLLTIYRGTTTAEDAANRNLDLALQESSRVGRTPSRLVNRYSQWLQREFTPAGPLAALETYIYTFGREYAKVAAGAALSIAGVHVSDVEAVNRLINASQSPQTLLSVATAIKNDMRNVAESYKDNLKKAVFDASISGVTAPGSIFQSAPNQGQPQSFSLPDGTIVHLQPDGTYQ